MREAAQNSPSLERSVCCYIAQRSSPGAAKVGSVQSEGATADVHIFGQVLCTQARELLLGGCC